MSPDSLLETRTPLRLAAQGKRGPLIVPLWFYWEGDRFWCASHRDAALIRALRDDDTVARIAASDLLPG